jgi:serine protease AprX
VGDEARSSDPIQKAMGKTGIGLDLLQMIQTKAAEPPAPLPPAEAARAPSFAPSDGALREAVAPAPPKPAMFSVVMEMNTAFPRGAGLARAILLKQFLKERAGSRVPDAKLARGVVTRMRPPTLPAEVTPLFHPEDQLAIANSLFTDHYLFGAVSLETINNLAALSIAGAGKAKRPMDSAPLYKVWQDHPIKPLVFSSTRTIKCDAARAAFTAAGKDIVWAVADTGIDAAHPHFHTHDTLRIKDLGLRHRDFTDLHATEAQAEKAALIDDAGHGTHVAGIIAGETRPTARRKIRIGTNVRTNDAVSDVATVDVVHDQPILGLAPQCKLISLRVLSSGETGLVSYLLAAIGYLQQVNEFGRNIKVHGLNISLGYPFLPQWFAAGQSPLCVEVDRLVRSGVAVVVAAGNAGYGQVTTADNRSEFASHQGTIADPGNSDLAITVGSTHRDMPHVFGVSYFSAKGPTADGRMKPDLVAPGERIVSCALMPTPAGDTGDIPFREMSGTSMAAPHVSGSIAAFLSVRSEFRGRAEAVKALFCANATDLKRKAEFQGAGLVDVLKTLQAV